MHEVQAAANAAQQAVVLAATAVKVTIDRLLVTGGVNDTLMQTSPDAVLECVRRHLCGDWGDLCPEDALQNDVSVADGGRLLSEYQVEGEKLWIITDARVAGYPTICTVLFPSEY